MEDAFGPSFGGGGAEKAPKKDKKKKKDGAMKKPKKQKKIKDDSTYEEGDEQEKKKKKKDKDKKKDKKKKKEKKTEDDALANNINNTEVSGAAPPLQQQFSRKSSTVKVDLSQLDISESNYAQEPDNALLDDDFGHQTNNNNNNNRTASGEGGYAAAAMPPQPPPPKPPQQSGKPLRPAPAVRPGAVAVSGGSTSYTRQGKSGSPSTNNQSRVGAVSVSAAAPRGKGQRGSTDSGAPPRVGAVSVSGAAPRGKGSGPSMATSSESYMQSSPGSASPGGNRLRVGAIAVMGAAPQGKKNRRSSGPSMSVGSESYESGQQQRPGAVSVNQAAPQRKGSTFSTNSSNTRVGAVSMSGGARPRTKSSESIDIMSDDGSTRVGAVSVDGAAPRGKAGGKGSVSAPVMAPSAEFYDGESAPADQQPGAVPVARAAAQGKQSRRASVDSTESAESITIGAIPSAGRAGLKTDDDNSQNPNRKQNVSHFPASDLYASLTSLHNEVSNPQNRPDSKGRVSQFPAYEEYEEDIEHGPSRGRKSIGGGSTESNEKDHLRPRYANGADNYGEPGRGLSRDPSASAQSSSSQNSSRSGTRGSGSYARRSAQGAFFISDERVETREPGIMTAGDDDHSEMEAEVTPAGPDDIPGNYRWPTPTPAPEQVPDGYQGSSQQKPRPWYCSPLFLIAVALLAAGGIAAVVAIPLMNNGETGPTPAPTRMVDEGRIASANTVLEGVTDLATLGNQTSPQFAAYEWLVLLDESSPLTSGSPTPEEAAKLTQRYTLASFFYATGGDTWTISGGWLDTKLDECEWDFITCVDGDVTVIDSGERETGNNLVGTIPSEMKELTSLSAVWLPLNKVSYVHPDMGQLTTLAALDLRGNSLDSTLPDYIYSLTNLEYLDLSSNLLKGQLPTEISQLTALQQLLIEQNDFSGTIANQLLNLANLRVLDISSNNFFGDFRDIIDGLVKLVFVKVVSNRIDGNLDGEQLSRLEDLQEIDVSFNRMTGTIPAELGSLSRLEYIFLDDNLFSGTIPVGLANGAPLILFSIQGGSRVEGSVPQELCNVQTLQSITVGCDIECTCAKCEKDSC